MIPLSIVALTVCTFVMVKHLLRDPTGYPARRRWFYDGAFIAYGLILIGFSYSGYHEARIIDEGWIFVAGMILGTCLLVLLPIARFRAHRLRGRSA